MPARTATAGPDADALVQQSAGPNAAASSGRIAGEIMITLNGAPAFAEPFSTTLNGIFSARKGSALPDYKIEMGVGDNGVELTAVAGRLYVSLGSTGYELPAAVRRRLVRSSERGANGLTRTLEQFGVAPARWETERRVAAVERIDGVDVVHIKTSFVAGRILKDANTLLGLMTSLGITRALGLPPAISKPARKIIIAGVQAKTGESWIGKRDKVLRRSGFKMTFEIAQPDRATLGGISSGKVVAMLDVSQVGRPQRITAPQTLRPFMEFELAMDALADSR